eukprot:COSAG03_NODE_14239_length_471_cov_7.333333_1_plen_90_part_10
MYASEELFFFEPDEDFFGMIFSVTERVPIRYIPSVCVSVCQSVCLTAVSVCLARYMPSENHARACSGTHSSAYSRTLAQKYSVRQRERER